MKPYFETMSYGPQGPRLFMIGVKLKTHIAIYFCVWKFVYYIGVKL